MTKPIFCANCQQELPHGFRVEMNTNRQEELISKCACGRELKFPASSTAEELRGHFARHRGANTGHVLAVEDVAAETHPVMKALAEVL